jgi:hypothetical protein
MEDKIGRIKGVLLAVIGLAYVIMGGVVIVKHWFLVNIEANTSYILGILLILYGLFRIYRAISNIQKGSL